MAKRKAAPVKKVYRKVNWRRFGSAVIGVDEVGRGCLAGPVGAAACLFVSGHLEKHVTDSKLLTAEKREVLFAKITEVHRVAVAYGSVEEVDEINILKAALLAMKRAVEQLEAMLVGTELAEHIGRAPIVVDGKFKIPGLPFERQTTLIKGDLRCAPISAASIVAKVSRDRLMKEQALLYPGYGFEFHKGYGTAEHRAALGQLGPCPNHRKTFAGVSELFLEDDDASAE